MKVRRVLKQISVFALIGTILATDITPAYAATSVAGVNETQDVSTDDTAECEVYAELGTNFKVIIPKSLTLDGKTKTGSYTVDVEGDIGGTDLIKVVPEKTFTLTSTGLASQTATVNQDKTQWSCSEILPDSKTIGNGSIAASGITAGSWNGTFWFNINLEEGTGSEGGGTETQSKLTLSESNVAMGTEDSVQVNAYLDGVIANDEVSWSSDNENIIVTNGLVETTANAEVGDTATVTVTANSTENLSAMSNLLSDLGIVTYASAAEDLSIDFTVTIVDIEYSVEELSLKAGESIDVTARIIPDTVTGTVTWSQTAISGINLVKNGNTVTVKVASDMEAGKSYNLVATYGDYSKTLKINIVTDHTHSYDAGVVTKEATCTEDGVKTFTCECGDSYTEVITATGHSFNNGTCTECGEADPDYVLEAGLYDADGNLLCTWEESGIDVEKDYSDSSSTSNFWKTCTTSPYYILTNRYSTTTKVVIPDSVTSIGNYAFYNCTSLTSISIPDSVKSIEDKAFYNCISLANIELPNSITSIGSWAFYKCTSLTSIEVPDSVTSIDASAFSNCTSLTSITIPDGVTSIEDYTFSNCTSLTSITIPNSVTSIGSWAFQYSGLTSITVPEGVTSLKDHAFGDSNLTSITIPSSVTSIGYNIFNRCKSLISINVDENNANYCSVDDVMFNKDMTTLIRYPIKKSATSYTIPSSVTSIGSQAFSGCTGLTSITIPSSVTSIENYAFQSCTGLTKVVIPSSVTSIRNDAFRNCASLTSITIPNGVTSIESNAFMSCASLTSITIPSSVTSIGVQVFSGCTNLTSVTFNSTTGWYVGDSKGAKTTAISSSKLANKSTAVTYLKSTYVFKYWTR